MNKELREDLEHLIICNDKSITQDLKDDIKMTLDYIDNLEEQLKELQKRFDFLMEAHIMSEQELEEKEDRIDKAIEVLKLCNSKCAKETINILRGKDNEN